MKCLIKKSLLILLTVVLGDLMQEKKLGKEHLDALEAKQFKLLNKKLMDNKPLNQREMEWYYGYVKKHGDIGDVEDLDMIGTNVTSYAKNQSELAKHLNVNRKTIQRWKKDPTFPKEKPDGRFSIREVVEWKDLHGARAGDLVSKESEQIRSMMLQNEKLEIQVGILRGEYTPNVDIDQHVSEMVQQAKRELLSLPSSLAPQVVGQSIAEAEKIIKQGVVDALKSLHENEWINHTKQKIDNDGEA
jgi:hypothetical protein